MLTGRVTANATAALVPAAVFGLENIAANAGGSLMVCTVMVSPALTASLSLDSSDSSLEYAGNLNDQGDDSGGSGFVTSVVGVR